MKTFIFLFILIPLQLGNSLEFKSELELLQGHPMVAKMGQINPKLSIEYRAEVVSNILSASAKYGIRPEKLFAIFAQESKFNVSALNKRTSDYGIGQVNIKNIKAYGWDKDLLLTDIGYSVDKSAHILSYFKKRFKKKETTWWTRYNSSKPEKREQYAVLVAQYM